MSHFSLVVRLASAPSESRRAEEIAHLAFIEWLAGLPGDASYPMAALLAYEDTREVARISPAAAAFRDLLVRSVEGAPRPLGLSLPAPGRRGGARNRRLPL